MRARWGCEDEEKLDQTALTASRSATGSASRDCRHTGKRSIAPEEGGRDTHMLELEVGALVGHALVANTELARGRLGRDGGVVELLRLDGIEGMGLVVEAVGVAGGGEAGGGEGVADVVLRFGRHGGWERERARIIYKTKLTFDNLQDGYAKLTFDSRHMSPSMSQHHTLSAHYSRVYKSLHFNSRYIDRRDRKEEKYGHGCINTRSRWPITASPQSSVIFSCSSGMGTKVSNTIIRKASSGSQCGGTSCRIRSGRTDSSASNTSGSRKDAIARPLTLACKVEKRREILAVGHSGAFLPQLVEEGVHHGFHRAQACAGRVFQEFRHQVNSLRRRAGPEDLSHT